jgi:hypothetical protein
MMRPELRTARKQDETETPQNHERPLFIDPGILIAE